MNSSHRSSSSCWCSCVRHASRRYAPCERVSSWSRWHWRGYCIQLTKRASAEEHLSEHLSHWHNRLSSAERVGRGASAVLVEAESRSCSCADMVGRGRRQPISGRRLRRVALADARRITGSDLESRDAALLLNLDVSLQRTQLSRQCKKSNRADYLHGPWWINRKVRHLLYFQSNLTVLAFCYTKSWQSLGKVLAS